MGLKHGQQSPGRRRQGAATTAHHQLGHGQGGFHFTGVVGVVVDDVAPFPGASPIKPAAGGFQSRESVHQLLEGNSLHPAGCQGACRVAEVVQSRQGQHEVPDRFALFIEKGMAAIAVELEWQSGEVDAVGFRDGPPGIGWKLLLNDWAILVSQDPVAAVCKATHRADQVVEIAVVVGVIEFKVGDQAQVGPEFHQRPIRFIGFGHQQSAMACMTIAFKAGNDAADDGSGIFAGFDQQGGDQGAGGCFSMAAGHGDRRLLIDQGSQQVGAMPDLQFRRTGTAQFWIAGWNRG